MGVETTVSGVVIETNDVPVLDVHRLGEFVPRVSSIDLFSGKVVNGLSLVLEQPHVVFVLVRIQSNLLLLASRWIH